jgi:cleavage and polyadenylation specificity factor subunit 4
VLSPRLLFVNLSNATSPKPNLPPAKAYEPPPPPSPRDLGPPPPGYGRYADFDRGTSAGPTSGGVQAPRRNLDDVLCFKVRPHNQ